MAAGPDARAVSLGPFDVTVGLCQDVTFVTNIVSAWSNAAFPVTGQPGFVVMTLQVTNPMLDVCNYIIQLQAADTSSAIYLTADALNTVTKNAWSDQFALFKQTYRVANSVYDFNSGQKRTGTINATALAGDVGAWQRMVTDFSTGNNPQAVKRRQDYDNQVQELANIAHQRAILKEGTTCPQPASTTPDYNNVVASQINPLQKTVTDSEVQVRFLRHELIELGPKFLHDIAEVRAYYDDVQNAFARAVTYKISESTRSATTQVPTGQANPDGTAVKMAQAVPQTIQAFSIVTSSQEFSDFKGLYLARYKQWAAVYWDKAAADPSAMRELQAAFKTMAYQCNETTLMQGYSLQGDEYNRQYAKSFKQCEQANSMTRQKLSGLMEEYLNYAIQALQQNKAAQGQIWTLQSQYLGQRRSVSLDQSGNYFQESVVCSQTPEEADLQLIQAKQAEVNASYNEIIARETVKNAMLRDEEIRRQQKTADDAKQQRQLIEKTSAAEKSAVASPASPDLGGAY
jgi:hypothetical protein